jgi:hypothetical protein
VDPSIEKVPEEAVNWDDEDRVSSVVKLPESGYLWIRRMYEAAREDAREGRRTSVLFFRTSPTRSTQLSADCTDPQFSGKADRIALSCARETAAENLLHETIVYDAATAHQLISVPRCRQPDLRSASELSCEAEGVDQEGTLHLQPKRVLVP